MQYQYNSIHSDIRAYENTYNNLSKLNSKFSITHPNVSWKGNNENTNELIIKNFSKTQFNFYYSSTSPAGDGKLNNRDNIFLEMKKRSNIFF